MTSPMTDLFTGLAAMAAAAGIGVTYSASGQYNSAQTGVYAKVMASKPDRIIAITPVPQGDRLELPSGDVMVQFRFRGLPGSPLDVDELGDSFLPIFHGARNLTFGSIVVNTMTRRVSAPMGQDQAKRWERADQYYLDVTYPSSTVRTGF